MSAISTDDPLKWIIVISDIKLGSIVGIWEYLRAQWGIVVHYVQSLTVAKFFPKIVSNKAAWTNLKHYAANA